MFEILKRIKSILSIKKENEVCNCELCNCEPCWCGKCDEFYHNNFLKACKKEGIKVIK